MFEELFLLAVFGIAIAHFEGVVVVYLRKNLGIHPKESNKASLQRFTKKDVFIEQTREAATIIMLLIIAWLTGESLTKKIVSFCL